VVGAILSSFCCRGVVVQPRPESGGSVRCAFGAFKRVLSITNKFSGINPSTTELYQSASAIKEKLETRDFELSESGFRSIDRDIIASSS